MRIDDLNSASQAHEAAKTDAIRPDKGKPSNASRGESGMDAANISDLAAALSPSEARLEALRLQVERGDYRPSAKDVAARIIDQHTNET